MRNRVGWLVVAVGVAAGGCASTAAAPNVEHLSRREVRLVRRIVHDLDPLVTERRAAGTLAVLTMDVVYAPLTARERAFLDAIRAIHPSQLQGSSQELPPTPPDVEFARLDGQVVFKEGAPTIVEAQYLPREVFEAYGRMMAAMERDLGRRLLVESGYRSPAYQLYLFVFYLSNHGYSIRETNRFVALPGYSEHGCPLRQAIDFMTQDGVNGDGKPEAFEARPEYAWLQAHAGAYGFVLSFPRHNPTNTSFEPWHWRYESPLASTAGP